MGKILLLAASLASSMFLLTQLFTYSEFRDVNPRNDVVFSTRKHEEDTVDLQNTVKSFLKICDKLGIAFVLVHQDTLLEFIEQERSHRASKQHNHHDCNVLCKRRYVAFRVLGEQLQDKINIFMRETTIAGFNVVEDEGQDERELSIEKRKTKRTLLYHLYMEQKNTMIHVVLAYPRLKGEWTNVCNLELSRDSYFHGYLQKSPYCTHQRLLKSLITTTATIDGIMIKIPESVLSFIENLNDGEFLPCNYDNARNFISSYGFDTSPESNLFRTKAKELLSIAVTALNELGIRFWLSSGTCLGWFRQCDFIPHSNDVDIGIWIKDYKEGLVSQFLKYGLKLKHRFGRIEDSFELSFTLSDLKLDIFFFYEAQDIMWNGGTQAKTGRKFKYLFPKFSLCWANIFELVVRVPCPSKPYIMANYGKNWKLLVKTWNWKESPPNVRENGEWPVEEQKEVIQVY